MSYLLKILKLIVHLLIIVFLTIFSQVGGLVYAFILLLTSVFNLGRRWTVGIFIGAYFFSSFVLLPFLAPIFGRTALPLMGNLRPLNFGTVLLNRHYVRPELKDHMKQVSDRIYKENDGTVTNYLDANFPFFDGFPLIPHLSHNDGRKLDLAFYYKYDGEVSDSAPSFIGYGVYEDPKNNETNVPTDCANRGYWQYGLLSSIVPQWNKNRYRPDPVKTRRLIELIAKDACTSKIFIEPHLKQRWNLGEFKKVRFHGCQAVRHDDHIHIQIR